MPCLSYFAKPLSFNWELLGYQVEITTFYPKLHWVTLGCEIGDFASLKIQKGQKGDSGFNSWEKDEVMINSKFWETLFTFLWITADCLCTFFHFPVISTVISILSYSTLVQLGYTAHSVACARFDKAGGFLRVIKHHIHYEWINSIKSSPIRTLTTIKPAMCIFHRTCYRRSSEIYPLTSRNKNISTTWIGVDPSLLAWILAFFFF